MQCTYRRYPFFTAALHPRPIVVPDLGAALLVRADNLSRNLALLQERLHPGELSSASAIESGLSATTYGLNEVSRAFRVDEDGRSTRRDTSFAIGPSRLGRHGQQTHPPSDCT